MRKPNILFAIADDASHMGAYGHKFVSTPNFDRVAEKGILFKNAYTVNPKCSPSRASILTGMHTWQLEEACCHHGLFSSKFPVYPDMLEANGYFIGYTGKGWAPGDWKRGGFKRNPAGNEYNQRTLVPPADTMISDTDYHENFRDFLKERPSDAPFYFWYGGKEPHRQYSEGEGIRAGKKLSDVNVPSYLPDCETVRSDLLDYANEVDWFDKHLGLILDEIDKLGELENTLVIVTSDNGMPFPRVKGQMYEQDFNLPLAICFGNRSKKGRIVEDLVSFIDFAPTLLEAAGINIPQQFQGKSLMNILLCENEGVTDASREYVFMGKERHDVGRVNDVGYPVRCIRSHEYLYIRNFKPELWPAGNPETYFTNVDNSPTKKYIVNQKEKGEEYYFNLSFGKRPQEELYHASDPECMNNLAYNDEYSEIKDKLWEKLKNKLIETDDPRIIGDPDVFDKYEYVGSEKRKWSYYLKGPF